MNLITFNAGLGNNCSQFVRALRCNANDIVFLQEIPSRNPGGNGNFYFTPNRENIAREAWKGYFPNHQLCFAPRDEYSIISLIPNDYTINEEIRLRIDNNHHFAQILVCKHNDNNIILANLHLKAGCNYHQTRATQWAKLQNILLRHQKHKAIIAGDFNSDQVPPWVRQICQPINTIFNDNGATTEAVDHICYANFSEPPAMGAQALKEEYTKETDAITGFGHGHIAISATIPMESIPPISSSEIGSIEITEPHNNDKLSSYYSIFKIGNSLIATTPSDSPPLELRNIAEQNTTLCLRDFEDSWGDDDPLSKAYPPCWLGNIYNNNIRIGHFWIDSEFISGPKAEPIGLVFR